MVAVTADAQQSLPAGCDEQPLPPHCPLQSFAQQAVLSRDMVPYLQSGSGAKAVIQGGLLNLHDTAALLIVVKQQPVELETKIQFDELIDRLNYRTNI